MLTQKGKNKSKSKVGITNAIDEEKINRALKLLFKRKYVPRDEIGLSDEEISYINEKFNYGIKVNEEGILVLNTQADESVVVLSPIPGTGIVRYLEVSNLLVGSVFFDEKSFRKMLDMAKEQLSEASGLGAEQEESDNQQ